MSAAEDSTQSSEAPSPTLSPSIRSSRFFGDNASRTSLSNSISNSDSDPPTDEESTGHLEDSDIDADSNTDSNTESESDLEAYRDIHTSNIEERKEAQSTREMITGSGERNFQYASPGVRNQLKSRLKHRRRRYDSDRRRSLQVPISRDFVLLLALCLVMACTAICFIRPVVVGWLVDDF